MKVLILSLTVAVISLSSWAFSRSSASPPSDTHTEWVAKSLKEIESVKVGMTRAELLKVFTSEGGLSTRRQQRYVYHECPYIKVDVEFEPVGPPEGQTIISSEDKITKISKPFLEWSILD